MAGGVQFTLADRTHEDGIRAVLREVSMEGDVALSLQCEPSYFDAIEIEGKAHRTVVAIEAGRVVGVGAVSARQRYLNGKPARVAYLSRLRLANTHAGRMDIVRRGYDALREQIASLRPDACFTSIARDNFRARRLLERGVRGLPAYRPLGECVTSLFQSPVQRWCGAPPIQHVRRCLRDRSISLRHGDPSLRDSIIAAVQRCGPAYQLSPCWTGEELDRCIEEYGMRDSHFRVLFDAEQPIACGAVWDQRPWKQAVVAGYSRRVERLRWLHNLGVGLWHRGVPLPPVGTTLPQAFVSHIATPPDRPELLAELVLLLTASARTMGVRLLSLGLDRRDPRLPFVHELFRPFTYHTLLYSVHWPEMKTVDLDDRLIQPEIALL